MCGRRAIYEHRQAQGLLTTARALVTASAALGEKKTTMKPANKKKTSPKPEGVTFRTQYRHYRTGKLMIATEYGYPVWPIGSRRKGR